MQHTNHAPTARRAGVFGYITVAIFGAATILVTFAAAWYWSDGDRVLSAAIGVASICVPIAFGFVTAEWKHQRAGAIAFVVAAGLFSGAVGAYAAQERDAFNERRLVVPDLDEDTGEDVETVDADDS